MKKLKILLLLTMMSLVVFNCSKDKDEDPSLIGTWAAVVGEGECPETVIIGQSTVTVKEYSGESCDFLEEYSFSYTRSGNMISVTIEGETFTSEIVELTNTTLKLKDTYVEGEVTYTEISVYTRQ